MTLLIQKTFNFVTTTLAGGTAAVALAVIITAAGGVIHGRLSNRWGDVDAQLLAAANLLEGTVEEFGPWKLRSSKPLDEFAVGILKCSAYLNRTYVHEKTGEMVNMAVVLGPFGPISTHTPDICYTSRDYKIVEQRKRIAVGEDEFWAVNLESKEVESNRIRVVYAWSDGGAWTAAAEPRLSFRGRPFLYKFQVAGYLHPYSDIRKDDPCRAFLQAFLPAARPNLYVSDPDE